MNRLTGLFQKRAKGETFMVSNEAIGYLVKNLEIPAETFFMQFGSIGDYYDRAKSNKGIMISGLIIACVGASMISASLPVLVADTMVPILQALKTHVNLKALIATNLAIEQLSAISKTMSPYFFATAIPGPLLVLSGAGMGAQGAFDQWRLKRKICNGPVKPAMR
ncbi:MAG TPA: hypothetical protein VIN59_04365 [Alphaproteobacteria bacterium]